jgi:predicted unusual protein kinase regulating ubiquinone biosynthesis (AarF/ABC1/UbiB family)
VKRGARRSRLARGFSVFFRLAPFLLAFLRDRKRWILVGGGARRTLDDHERRANQLVAAVATLGPTFIKLAQLFSARADILPEPYLSRIGTLQDQVPADAAQDIIDVIEAELGRPVGELFDAFDREPMATASLGQVHRARVGEREVAVKVLRPGVEDLVALDLDISFRLIFWLNILFPNHHVRALTNVVREFSHKVRQEMDFRLEAEHTQRFQRSFGSDPRVKAPAVLERFVTRRVLVTEFCQGTKIDRLQPLFDSGKLTFSEVTETLTGMYLRMMMVDGFLHADPHPGNILVQDDGTILMLDWGMVVEVPRWTRESILNISLAVMREDLDGIINGMYQLGMISPEVSRGEIREAATELMRVLEKVRSTNRQKIQELVQEILDTFYTWPLMLPQELVYFFRAAALLEGIGFRYDPNFDGLQFIRGVIRKHKAEIARATGKEPAAVARGVMEETQGALRSFRDLISRAEREELRVRIHPRDIQTQERFLHLQARRLLLSIFATATALITSILFIAIRHWLLLTVGLGTSLVMFVIVFFIPTHLLENPLRHARSIRPSDGRR